jgi:3-mercaptopropionate dioxygenase
MRAMKLEQFVHALESVIATHGQDEAALLNKAQPLLADLIAKDDWLPAEYNLESKATYQQYLLYKDPQARFSVVSFVWGPGQQTPIHDHTVWGMIGVLRGAELCQHFAPDAQGKWQAQDAHVLRQGEIDLVSPRLGDVHRVSNALADRSTVSIHVYGADIGEVRRHVFEGPNFAMRDFVSGYVNQAPMLLPA